MAAAILTLGRDGAQELIALRQRFPRTTLYRRAGALVRNKLVERVGRGYRTTAAGLATLAAEEHPALAEPAGLAKHIPRLKLLPTLLHIAIIELILAAAVVRKYELAPDHHFAFLLVGPRLRWKTWCGAVAAVLLGANPRRAVIYLPAEAGRSMSFRRTAAGKTASKRATLDMRLVVLDEYGRCTPEVRREVQIYLHGSISVPYEAEIVRVCPVPVVTLNPKKKNGELLERLGMDEGQVRRSIVADFAATEIPPGVLTEGDSLLSSIGAEGAVALPPPKNPKLAASKRIQRFLETALTDHEVLGLIDLRGLEMLAAGMTSWLPPEEALHRLVFDYCTVAETLHWLKADWRPALAREFGAKENKMDTQQKPAPPEPQPTNDLDYERRLADLSTACHEAGVVPAEAARAIRDLKALEECGFGLRVARQMIAGLKMRGTDPRQSSKLIAGCIAQGAGLTAAVQQLRTDEQQLLKSCNGLKVDRDTLQKEIRALGWNRQTVADLRAAGDALTKAGVTAAQAGALAQTAVNLSEVLGVPPDKVSDTMTAMATVFAREFAAHLPEAKDPEVLATIVAALAATDVRLDHSIATKKRTQELLTEETTWQEPEIAKQRARVERYELLLASMVEELKALKPRLRRKYAQRRALRADVERLRKEKRALAMSSAAATTTPPPPGRQGTGPAGPAGSP